MVLDPADLGFLRQQVFQVAAPARRVLAGAVAARRRPIEDAFNSAAHPARRFRLHRPYRLDRAQHEPDIDRLHRQAAEHGIDVGIEGRRPLRGVLGVAPAGLVRIDVLLGASGEAHRPGRVEHGRGTTSATPLQRINPIEPSLAVFQRFLARIGEPDSMQRPETNIMQAGRRVDSETPTIYRRSGRSSDRDRRHRRACLAWSPSER